MSPLTLHQTRMCQDGHRQLVSSARPVSHHREGSQGSKMLTKAWQCEPWAECRQQPPASPSGALLRPGALHHEHSMLDWEEQGWYLNWRKLIWKLSVGMDAIW